MKKTLLFPISAFLMLLCLMNTAYAKPMIKNDGDILLIDFGDKTESGWINADVKTKYNSETGFGWSMISYIENETLSGNSVLADAVKIKLNCEEKTEFKIDLTPGIYDISVYSGNIRFMTVGFEGHPTIINLEYPSSEARVQIPVSDGQLNMSLMRGGGGTDLSVAAMTVKKVSSLQERKQRIFICGDSTAATFYPLFMYQPLEDGYRGGWGQMLSEYLSENVYVHNISSQGQSAKSFIESGNLDSTLFFMEEGDYAFISFGINDFNEYTENEYISYMSQIIQAIKNKGGIPLIISSPPYLYDFDLNGIYNGADRCFSSASEELAKENNLMYIDLNSLCGEFYSLICYEQLSHMYWTNWGGTKDNIHLSRNGAGQLARIVAEECSEKGLDFVSEGVLNSPESDSEIRCTANKNNVYLQNVSPSEKELMIVTNTIRGGKLTNSSSFSVSLPAFDVLEPYKTTQITLPLYDKNKHSFIMGENISVLLEWINK